MEITTQFVKLTPRQKVNALNELIEVLELAGEDCIKDIKYKGLWVDNFFICEMYRDLIGRNFQEDFWNEMPLIRNGNRFSFSLSANMEENALEFSDYSSRQIKILVLEILKQLILNQ